MSAPDPAKKPRRAWRDRPIMTRVEFQGGPLDGQVGDVPMELEFATLEQLGKLMPVPEPRAFTHGRQADVKHEDIERAAQTAPGRYGRRQIGKDAGFTFVWYPDEEF